MFIRSSADSLRGKGKARLLTVEEVPEATAKVEKRLRDGSPEGKRKPVGKYHVITGRR